MKKSKVIRLITNLQKRYFAYLYSLSSQEFTYIAIGDSTVEGIGASNPARSYANIVFHHIKNRFKKAKFFNIGKSGATISDVITDQLKFTLETKPNLVTVSVGANDILHYTSVTRFRAKLLYLIEKIKQDTNATIVLCSIPNFSLAPAVGKPFRFFANIQIKRFNKCIYECAKKTHIIHVDMYDQSSIFAKHYPELIATDNFHPSDFGYAIWANTIVSRISHILFTQYA